MVTLIGNCLTRKDYKMNKNIIQDNYTFTLRQLKSAWQLSYNEDLEEEYSGFVNLLNHMIEERENS